jgi:uncharacterized protein YjbI with pentapeptide repeats
MSSGATTCTVAGLVNGDTYTIEVSAFNAKGKSHVSKMVDGTPSTTQECSYIGPHANLQNCDLANVNLNDANLAEANLSGANLSDASLIDTNLTNASLFDANLTGVSMTGDTLTGVSSGGITGTPAGLPANWTFVDGFLIGPGANLTFAALQNANLVDADLDGATVYAANLSGCDLTDANLTDANLMGTALENTDLTGTEFSGANLMAVNSGGITGAPSSLPAQWMVADGFLLGPDVNLEDADLANGNLTGAVLADANLQGADMTGAILTDVSSGGIESTPSSLPTNWTLFDGYLFGPGANLSSADFDGQVIDSMDLAGADLSGANLSDAVVYGDNLSGANISGANFAGSKFNDLSSGGVVGTPTALPTNWLLTGGYLIGPTANLTGADLAGLDLTDADLTGVRSGGIVGTPIGLPANWSLIGGYLVGPGAYLNGANLSGFDLSSIDLTGANLSNTNLTNADLSDANLDGVLSGGITGTPSSLPSNWLLTVGYLIGPGLFVQYANLTDADLEDADLVDTTLISDNFTDADLAGANLTGAAFDYDTWSNTTCPDGTNSDNDGYTCLNNLILPDAPTNVSAVPGDGQAMVSWAAPDNDIAADVTSYTVIASDVTAPGTDGGGNTCTGTDPTDTCTVIGLTDGDSYTFTATAFNENNVPGPASAPSSPVMPTA